MAKVLLRVLQLKLLLEQAKRKPLCFISVHHCDMDELEVKIKINVQRKHLTAEPPRVPGNDRKHAANLNIKQHGCAQNRYSKSRIYCVVNHNKT